MLQAYILETFTKLNLILSIASLAICGFGLFTLMYRVANGQTPVTKADLVYVIIMVILVALYIIIPDGVALTRVMNLLN